MYLLAELASLVVLWLFFSSPPSNNVDLIKSYFHPASEVFYSVDWQPHPYLGYRNPNRIQGLEEANAHKPTDEYWVGIFGGSFAEMFVTDTPAKSRFEAHLQKYPSAKGKKVRLFNMAHGGYKQPQQSLAYTLYGNKLDMVLNIEGYNEVSDFLLGGPFPHFYPVTTFRHYYKEWPEYGYILASRAIGSFLRRYYYGFLGSPKVHYSPLVTLGLVISIRATGPINVWLSILFQKRYLTKNTNRPNSSSPESVNEKISIWEKFTRKQHRLAQASKIPIWFFLQPNQHLENRKTFSSWEKENALSTYQLVVGPHYQQLIDLGKTLQTENIPVVDLSHVFKDIKVSVYKDACCHINSLGNLILADAMAEHILQQPVERVPIPPMDEEQ